MYAPTRSTALAVFPEKRDGTASAVHLEVYEGQVVAGDADGLYAARIAAMTATLNELLPVK
jgi:hypothetical protein